jgi:hypothetical protein
MGTYLCDHDRIEGNYGAFVRDGNIAYSPDVDALLEP